MWYKSPTWILNFSLRASLGVTLVIFGISFYRDFAPFHANVTDGLGGIEFLGTLWTYLLPALFIFAGGLLLIGRYAFITAWIAGIALGSIPVGMALKVLMTNYPLEGALTFIYPIFIWLLVLHLAIKESPPPEPKRDDEEDGD